MDSQSQKSKVPRSKTAHSPKERSYMAEDKVGNLEKTGT